MFTEKELKFELCGNGKEGINLNPLTLQLFAPLNVEVGD